MAVSDTEYTALLVGMESSGKTTMFLTLKGKKWKAGTSPPRPTLGYDHAQVSVAPAKEKRLSFRGMRGMLPMGSSQKKTCALYDVGGSEESHTFVAHWFKTVGAVVLVIDPNSSRRPGVDTLSDGITVKSKLLDVLRSTETTVPLAIVLNNKGLEADSRSLTKKDVEYWLDLKNTINGERLDDEGSHSGLESREQKEGEADDVDILREPIPSPPTATRLRTVQRRDYKVFECDTRDKVAVNDVMYWLFSPKGPTLGKRPSFELPPTVDPTPSVEDMPWTPGISQTPGAYEFLRKGSGTGDGTPLADDRPTIVTFDLKKTGPWAISCPCQFAGGCKKDAKFSHPEGHCCLVCGKWYCHFHTPVSMAVAKSKKHGSGLKCIGCRRKTRTDWQAQEQTTHLKASVRRWKGLPPEIEMDEINDVQGIGEVLVEEWSTDRLFNVAFTKLPYLVQMTGVELESFFPTAWRLWHEQMHQKQELERRSADVS